MKSMRPWVYVSTWLIGSAVLGAYLPCVVLGQGTDRGRDVVERMQQSTQGYGSFVADLEMRIFTDEGRQRVRTMTVSSLESESGDRTLIILKTPVDLSGISFLSVLGAGGSRAQWIYLPSARRARRIGGGQSDDAFLGSHFTYRDMSSPIVDDYSYRWIRAQDIDGRPGALVERCHTTCTAETGHELLWIETDRHVLRRVDFFGVDGARTRTLTLEDYLQADGFWRPMFIEMIDVLEGGRTELHWSEWRIGVELRERDFEAARLGRGR